MARRFDNKTTYKVKGNLGVYAVTMERQRNGVNGEPRWEAQITRLDNLINWNATWTVCYRFSGHYYNEADEAEWIVKHYEEEQDDA